MGGTADTKTRARERLKELRAALADSRRRADSDAIRERLLALPEVRAARTVFCFISCGNEVDTRVLIDALLRDGRELYVPRISGGRMDAIRFRGWQALQPGELGIPTPAAEAPYEGAVDLCITPGLGFSAAGHRLGMGRGYYDRWFSEHPVGFRVAVAFDCQLLDQIPVDTGDVPVDAVVTPGRVLHTGTHTGTGL